MPIATPQGTLDFKSVDKVTFVGASSNTVIDTTTGSLGVGVGVGGPTSNLHVVGHTRLEGDINMLHTSNTASIKLNSNVVTEFPRSKKLIKYPRVALTRASQDGYVVSESSYYGTTSVYASWKAFDGKEDSSSWISEDLTYTADGIAIGATAVDTFESIAGSWLGIELPNKIKLEYVIIRNRNSATIRNVEDGIIWAKHKTESTWYRIHDFSGLNTDSNAIHTIHVNQTNVYDEYRLQFTKIHPRVGGGAASIGELAFFGTPEYDPEAHGTDVTIKSYPNVPNTDWLEVYYDAKDLADGAVSTTSGAITGLGGTTNNGTAFGDPQVSNGAFVFDGTGDYITNTRSGYSSSGTYTVSTWVNISREASGQTNPNIFQYGVGQTSTTDTGFGLITNSSDDRIQAFVYGNNDFVVYGIKKYGTWIHLTSIYELSASGTNITLYVNGNNMGSQATSTAAGIGATPHLIIGAQANASDLPIPATYFNGSIANFRLFNRALTTDEIWQLYAYQKEYFGHGDLGMTLKAGRLGIGTSEPRAMLDVRGDIYAPGTIVQVEQTVKTNPSAVTSTTEVDIGGLSVDITPKFGTSKVLVSYTVNVGVDITGTSNMHGFLRVKRTQGGISTYIGDGASSNSRQVCTSYIYNTVNNQCESFSFEHLDDANGIDTITYQIQGLVEASVYTMTINRSGSDGNNGYYGRTSSSITVKEVCQ